jgi:ElaB/YqjD/DUF883 family membrane-anchored ribosome-binding protein
MHLRSSINQGTIMEKSPFPSSASDSNPTAVTRGVDTAGSALHSGIDKVADPARQAVDRMSSVAHQTVDKVASSASETAWRFSDQTRRLTEAPAKALESSKAMVLDKPLQAVAAALAIGFVLGRLTAR